MADTPTYHINLWPEPPGPPTYLCLLCSLTDCTHSDILAHIPAAHAVAAVPTPLAREPAVVLRLATEGEAMAEATYYVLPATDGTPIYHCCYCQAQGTMHVANDFDLFTMHMQQRHDGRLQAMSPEEAAALQHAAAQHADAHQTDADQAAPTADVSPGGYPAEDADTVPAPASEAPFPPARAPDEV